MTTAVCDDFRWAGRLGGPHVDVEDILQEVFMVVHRQLASFRGDSLVTTWLFAITRNRQAAVAKRSPPALPFDRTVFVLFEIEGLPGEEVVALTGLSIATLRVQLMAGVGWALRPNVRPVEPAASVAAFDPPPFEGRTASPAGEVVPPPQATAAPSTSDDLNLKVFTATYLGGTGDDAPVAVAILDTQTILYGGILGQGDLGTKAHQLFDGGDAALVRLGRQGRNVLSVTRIGRSLTDMKVDGLGRVLVLGQPFGLVALDNRAQEVLWKNVFWVPGLAWDQMGPLGCSMRWMAPCGLFPSKDSR